MNNPIPLPTDNIYKFYALFGLLLVIFSLSATIYINSSTNAFAFEIAVEYAILKADPERTVSQEARFQILQNKLEVNELNKKFYLYSLGIIIGIGIFIITYGFRKWHTEVQPIQDEIARLSLKKLEKEVDKNECT